MTISTNDQQVNTKKFNDNFDKIFGKDKPVQRGSFVQTDEGMVPRGTYIRQETNAPAVHGDIENFISPITREVISDRAQLRRHDKQHGVTNMADYSSEFMAKRVQKRENELSGNNAQAKQERVAIIQAELTRRGL